MREHQRAHAACQAVLLRGLEADKELAAMDVQAKRNELESIEAEIRVLKGGVSRKRVRLPLRRESTFNSL